MPTPSCIYCSSGVGSTRDHVPPKAFFQSPIPRDAQLITVPCREACRQRDQANDELVRNILVSIEDTEGIEYVSKHVLPRRDRAIERSSSQLSKMKGFTRWVTRRSEKGEVLREDWAFSLSDPRISQFLERVGRALLFAETKQGYFEAKFGWRLDPHISPKFYQIAIARYPNRKILEAFAYVVLPTAKRVEFVIVQFYGRIEFLLRFEKKA